MAEVHHFSYGLVTPTVAYSLSVLGSLLGLLCTARVRTARTRGQRAWWLLLAAWAIGGTGIWSMHFMAMLGFSVSGRLIRYDVLITAASAVLCIAVVGFGLFLAGMGRRSLLRTAFGGLFTGLGVAAMHYTGMGAMRLDAIVDYDRSLVIASVIIAVVAATVALWFTVTLTRPLVIAGAALVMGVAVTGMHYTGMAAMSVTLIDPTFELSGASARTLLVPIGMLVLLVFGALVYAMGAAPRDEDFDGRAYLEQRQAQRTAPAPPQRGTIRRPTVVPPRAG